MRPRPESARITSALRVSSLAAERALTSTNCFRFVCTFFLPVRCPCIFASGNSGLAPSILFCSFEGPCRVACMKLVGHGAQATVTSPSLEFTVHLQINCAGAWNPFPSLVLAQGSFCNTRPSHALAVICEQGANNGSPKSPFAEAFGRGG